MIHTDDWVDAKDMALSHPKTFQAPTESELASICPKCTVKISNGKERFFVLVQKVMDDGTIEGTVNNHLVCGSPYNYNDKVRFHKNNVFVVHTPAFLQSMATGFFQGKSKEEMMTMLGSLFDQVHNGTNNTRVVRSHVNDKH
jgi:predicted RNase H-like HicB family nuclease